MPIRAEMRRRYPKDWKKISAAIRKRANDACEGCGARNGRPHPITGSTVVLTVAHLDHHPRTTRRRTCGPGARSATTPTTCCTGS